MAVVTYEIHKLGTAQLPSHRALAAHCIMTHPGSRRGCDAAADKQRPHGGSCGFITVTGVCLWMPTHTPPNKCQALHNPFLSPFPASPTVTQVTASGAVERLILAKFYFNFSSTHK